MADHDPVILSAVRTPIGGLGGALAEIPATRLGSVALAEAAKKAGLTPDQIDEVICGNVLSAGLGQAPGRQVALGAGLPRQVNCLSINKVCGSSLKAAMLASDGIAAGRAEVIAAVGIENMSGAPYLLPNGRRGYRLGHGQVIDSMIHDGLWDVYNDFHMGQGAELCARRFKISRKEQDDYAAASYTKALGAQNKGLFNAEIVPVTIPRQKGDPIILLEDEEPHRVDFKKIPRLKPAFEKDGTITVANASPISDGAAAVIIASARTAKALKVRPLARIVGYSQASTDPEWFSIAPVIAVKKLLKSTGIPLSKIDLIELHEAFSATSIAVIRELGLDVKRVNVRGGAVALGHPIGASGARILTTLVHTMLDLNKRRGIATLCIGGGEAVAMLIERA